MAEDKQDKIIELLARINLQHKTIIHNQQVNFDNQAVLSNNIKDTQKAIVKSINNLTSSTNAVLNQLKYINKDMNYYVVDREDKILSRMKDESQYNFDNFEYLNVLVRMMITMMKLGSDIFSSTNAVARKQGATFYTTDFSPKGYRTFADTYENILDQHKYYPGNDDDN